MNDTAMIAKIRVALATVDDPATDRQAVIEEIDRIINADAPAPADFPGVPMGLLAYDISDRIGDDEYSGLDFMHQDSIEPNLPAFLAACKATDAAETEDPS